ncbi:SDR family NAD(P)-dependent oxidoreductase [Rhodococcus koreensis]|uniref:NAD(P)-dependent dehydrogenase, short-chain alcohol dehydrogenase family n=1 Tax=Rhodococcus koreensis TaxID=99653 RepID=A0A1H4IE62_9NOCA|nr:SDR family NAD(P)-dependent oxidoreductase [Rhodococcus koreensis]SEB31618.1 NAD(P)-dependent dehydrogenase, short-chain alcohol dehydrogenase family [Rhodococcus koreensis]
MGRMQDMVAIVTGAASGIGAAAAQRLVEEGASVLLVDRSEENLERVAAGLDGNVDIAAADISDRGQVDDYTRRAVERFGGLDAVLLNAGIFGDMAPVDAYDEKRFDEVISVNVKGTWHGLRAAVPHLRNRGGGSIVVTSSTQGLSAYFHSSPYTASKHAVVGIAKNAAMDLARDNIRVNTVHPGIIDTRMMGELHETASPQDPDAAMTAFATSIPMGRYGRPAEIADLMLFLASNDSSYCTGGTFVADGGLTAFHGGPIPD